MFVLGDIVEVTSESTGFTWQEDGTRGEVIEVDPLDNSLKVQTDDDVFWAYQSRVKKVTPDAVAQARKLLEDAGYKVKSLEVHKDVVWRAGDVVDLKYTENGTWYTFVKGAPNWPGDDRVNQKLAKAYANPVLQADPNNNGASVPFDQSRLV